MMFSQEQLFHFSIFPLVCVTALIASHFSYVRKKRAYKVIGLGSGFLLLSQLLQFLSWLDLFPATQDFMGISSRGLIVIGCCLSIFGVCHLFRVVNRKLRFFIYAGLFVFFLGAVFFPMISSIVFIAMGVTVIFYVNKWIEHSNKFVPALIGCFVISETGNVIGLLFSNNFGLWIHLLGYFMFMMLLVFLLIGRVADKLNKSQRDSVVDMLTGLYNRRYFTVLLKRYIERKRTVHLIFVDLDNFKNLNDTLGHDKGDEALKTVAQILMEEVDGKGFAGRYGGEEIVLLITKQGIRIDDFAERIRYRIESESSPRVTASIGFSSWSEGISTDDLIQRADKAMYHSKTTGKNKVTAFVG